MIYNPSRTATFVLPQSWASPIAESAMTGLSLSPSQTQDPLGILGRVVRVLVGYFHQS